MVAMKYIALPTDISNPETDRLRALAVRAIKQGMYDDGARLAMRARAAALKLRSRAQQTDVRLGLITYGPAQYLISAAVRHLRAKRYRDALHAAQLAADLYEYSRVSAYDLRESWEIIGLAHRGLGEEREMNNAFMLAEMSDPQPRRRAWSRWTTRLGRDAGPGLVASRSGGADGDEEAGGGTGDGEPDGPVGVDEQL